MVVLMMNFFVSFCCPLSFCRSFLFLSRDFEPIVEQLSLIAKQISFEISMPISYISRIHFDFNSSRLERYTFEEKDETTQDHYLHMLVSKALLL